MVIAINAHRIAYMAVPKAACTSVKAALACVDPENDHTLETISKNSEIVHAIYPTKRFRPHRWEKYEGWSRFTVVRDPLKRLLSVYSDRVEGRKGLLNSPKLKRQSELTATPNPDEFFLNISAYMKLASVIKHHALPTWLFTGKAPVEGKYDHVFKIEEIPELEIYLSEVVGDQVSLPRFNKSSQKLTFDTLEPKTQDHLAVFLADEYEYLKGFYENPFK